VDDVDDVVGGGRGRTQVELSSGNAEEEAAAAAVGAAAAAELVEVPIGLWSTTIAEVEEIGMVPREEMVCRLARVRHVSRCWTEEEKVDNMNSCPGMNQLVAQWYWW